MKYLKPWNAIWRFSSRSKDTIRLTAYVDRPGTSDHTRGIHIFLTLKEARQLMGELEALTKDRKELENETLT